MIDLALTRLLTPIGEQIRQEADGVAKTLNAGDGALAVEDLKRQFEIRRSVQALRERFMRAFAAVPESHSLRIVVADSIADCYSALGNALCAPERSPREGTKILTEALEIAASEGARLRIQRRLRVSQWNLAMQDFGAAMENADSVAAGQALAGLEAAYEATDADEITQALQQCRGALERLKRVPTSPSLWTLNGWGTRIYGKASPDSATGAYTGTLFFTIFWIPVLALARYRMRDAEGGGYYFQEKVPLGEFGWGWNVIAGAVLALLVLTNQSDSTTSSPNPPSTSPRPVHNSPPGRSAGTESSNSLSENRVPPPEGGTRAPESLASIGREIDRLRPQLELTDQALDVEKEGIESDQAAVAQLRRRIEGRRAQSPDGLGDEELAVDRRDVADHNERLELLKQRIARYKEQRGAYQSEVRRFNAMVDEYNLRLKKVRR